MKTLKLFIITLLLTAFTASGGNLHNISFSLTEVNSIVEYPSGRLWVGTKYGLFEYNGYSFRRYTNPDHPSGAGACIEAILPVGEDWLCVGTHWGVMWLNLRSGEYGDPYPEVKGMGAVRSLKKIGDRLWIGTRDNGLWSMDVRDMFFPYVRPQESGNRTDVRWVTLTDDSGFGLAVVAEDKALNFTAVDIDMATVDPGLSKAQRHIDDIHHDRTRIWLNVDLAQRGLGGDDSWGRPPHKPYILDARHYEYSYLLIPIR